MEQFKEQLFPTDFIFDYIKDEPHKKRFLTFVAFRFFSFAGETDPSLPARLKEALSCPFTPQSFCAVEDYLMDDYYFSPTLKQGSFEPLYLYAAIALMHAAHPSELAFFETLLEEYCPAAASLSYQEETLQLSACIQTGADFYAALYLASTRYEVLLPRLLSKFTDAYDEAYHFTSEDFILFDFMDEYFGQKHCICHPAFSALVDSLVAATLNYYATDLEALLNHEVQQLSSGSASRFAGTKCIGSVALSNLPETDTACRMLTELFRYAAIYELRNNLFDFHIEDDTWITLENWKENLRWHYVQYANVYQLALDSFHSALLARELLKAEFTKNLLALQE